MALMHFRLATLRRYPALRLVLGSARGLQRWPWRHSLAGLRSRFDELRLGETAGSLTFTTLIALVPLMVMVFALFTLFPVFASFQRALEQYFLATLIPEDIAKPVLRWVTQFAGKARGLGTAGAALLGVTALALMLTIDRTLNAIWRVKRPRPLAQRVLVFWAMLTLGPLLLGGSLALTSYAVSANRGLVAQLPGGLETFLDAVQFMVLTASVAGLFHFMPNTHVRWRHALLGALFVAAGLTLAKLGLAWWLQRVPTYATLYGAFATLPIFLIWIYLGWVIVLLGALLAANAPGLLQGLIQRAPGPGMEFGLSLGVVRELWARQRRGAAGATALALAQQLRVDPLQLAPVLEGLQALDWVGRLEESGAQRLVLLRNPTETLAAPLIQRCLAPRSPELARLWLQSQWENRPLADLL
jgi:membrane protein